LEGENAVIRRVSSCNTFVGVHGFKVHRSGLRTKKALKTGQPFNGSGVQRLYSHRHTPFCTGELTASTSPHMVLGDYISKPVFFGSISEEFQFFS